MKDYQIKEVVNRISDCLESEIKESKHFNIRNIQRITDLAMVYNSLINDDLMGILKQDYNKFILLYDHKTIKSKDLGIVIAMREEYIYLVTVFLNPKNRKGK